MIKKALLQRKVPKKTPNTSELLDLFSDTTGSRKKIPNKDNQPKNDASNSLPKYMSYTPIRQEHKDFHKPRKSFVPQSPDTLVIPSILTKKTLPKKQNTSNPLVNVVDYDPDLTKELSSNLYASILRSPIRMNRLTRRSFPRDLLIPVGFEVWANDKVEDVTEQMCKELELELKDMLSTDFNFSTKDLAQYSKANSNAPDTPLDSVNKSPDPTKQCVRIYPKHGHTLLKNAGGSTYIPSHISSAQYFLNKWVEFAPTITSNSTKSALGPFFSGLSTALSRKRRGTAVNSEPSTQPDSVPSDEEKKTFDPHAPKTFMCPSNFIFLIPVLLLQDMEKEICKVLRHHIIRLGLPMPENEYFYRIVLKKEGSKDETLCETKNKYCTEVIFPHQMMPPSHANKLCDIIVKQLSQFPKLENTKDLAYIDVPSITGLKLQTLLYKYNNYFMSKEGSHQSFFHDEPKM